jgi:methylated-DNA-[protein]-cysteine S-methyltransferase
MDDARPDRLILDYLETPIGKALLVGDGQGFLRALDWQDHEPRMRLLLRRRYGSAVTVQAGRLPAAVRDALAAYFAGALTRLNDIECAPAGTRFQRAVWAALRKIPAGRTSTYGALAARLGHPKGGRAVGLANGANPIAIVIPCHRVLGADGALTGYGGGLDRKRWLLAHEGAPGSAPRRAGIDGFADPAILDS